MTGTFFFIVLPSLAVFSFIAGSIYRYYYHGFQVSSLSSQLLESKILFFGSRPFHWGIVTLLLGHLTGFLIPSGVLAWNSKPARLYVLEITALAFALLALTGLAILIYRRLKVKRIRLVTSRMDVFVFVILSLSVLSGIYTAFFFRWGSSWFAAVMAPYLKSVLILKPDLTSVNTLPVMVKIHLITTFILIGMAPYTRFIHILVYPLHYFWRAYQVVIWNKRVPHDKSVQV
ncbi:MAG TPA: respiratory nitrate reductase subunit gamma [Bacteroidales bacterium]|nr:respiratory nitrate reductase subunit gamma [Bacteroidales bacterium]